MLADRLVVIDAGELLQQGSPDSIHRAPRNARVADLVGIHNRFEGKWLGAAEHAGYGLLRWSINGSDGPTLRVRDKGRLPTGQAVTWVIPSDGITLSDDPPTDTGEFVAEVIEARHLGEITLAVLGLSDVPGARLRLTLSGPQRRQFLVGSTLRARLDLDLVHVMPLRRTQKP
jgi:molybdate transport system ATP-binding protein